MASIGEIRGMAVRGGFDRAIDDLYRMDEMNRRSQAMNEAKARVFADDLEFQNAANPFDNPRIKEYAKGQIQKIGQFVSENPDWATNVQKRMYLNQMKRELKDNPFLLQGVASDNAFKQLNADLAEVAKNPQQHDQDAYQEILRQRDNYLKYGNQKGEEAALTEGSHPFVYQKPRDFINLPETLLKAGNSINPSLVIKGKNLGEFTRTADPNHVKAIKDSIWKENGRQVQVEAQKLGLNTPEQIDKWLTDGIMAGVKTVYDAGDPNALWERGMRERELAAKKKGTQANSTNYSPWDDLFRKDKPAGYISPEAAVKVWGENPKIVVSNSNGTNQVDLTGQKWTPDGRYLTDGNGVRRVTGKVKVPLQVAYQTGIWKADDFKDNPTDGEIDKTYYGKAVRRSDDKGNMYIEMDYALPLDPTNGSDKELYNTHVLPDKLVSPLEGELPGQQSYQKSNVPTGSVGDFKAAGWSDNQIQQALQLGKIKVI